MSTTQTLIVYGLQGGGKTLLTSIILGSSNRLLSNFDIFKNGKIINDKLINVGQFDNLKYSNVPGFIGIDEIGLNFNSKNHSSEKNKKMSEMFFLIRKFNFSSVFVSQRYDSIPIDIRDLCVLIFKVESHFDKYYKKMLFTVTLQSRRKTENGDILEDIDENVYDLIGLLNILGYSYNSLEASLIS